MKTVLLVDDNLLIVENLIEAFELEGYKVMAANNGNEALEIAKNHKPDIIIAEVTIGDLDDFGILNHLNTTPNLNDIPFVFCTTRCEKSEKHKAMQLGARDYIIKPFELDYLFKATKKLIIHN